MEPASREARGIFGSGSQQPFSLAILRPSDDLSGVIEYFWLVEWNLEGEPSRLAETLPHPTQHIVSDPTGTSGIFGLQRGKFSHVLQGAGKAVGLKFQPGAFRGYFGKPVSLSTDRILPIDEVFTTSNTELEQAFMTLEDPAEIIAILEALLNARRPRHDPTAAKVAAMVNVIEATPDLYSVSRLANLTGTTTRSLQRLFDRYVGAGPKWVIDRYRMIQALEALHAGAEMSLTDLAHDLGYFDQAHFTRAFQALTGSAPSDYRRG